MISSDSDLHTGPRVAGTCADSRVEIPALTTEDYLTIMRRAQIAANWAWQADDPDGALEHELRASIALQQALDTLKEQG